MVGVSGIYGRGYLFRSRPMWRPDPTAKRKKGPNRNAAHKDASKPRTGRTIPLHEQIARAETSLESHAINVGKATVTYHNAKAYRDRGAYGNLGTYREADQAVAKAATGLRKARANYEKAKAKLAELGALLHEQSPSSVSRSIDLLSLSQVEDLQNLEREQPGVTVPLPAERQRPKDATYATREGQAKFRGMVLETYGGCAITGCKDSAVLEAAHIIPYVDARSHLITNGICFRADLHLLFDCDMLKITNDYTVAISRNIRCAEYQALDGGKLILPKNKAEWPDLHLLSIRDAYI